MTQRENPATPTGTELNTEQVQAIGGGDCSLSDYLTAVDQFKAAYESLIEFTSYVIERVGGP
jgi:hypothetical protein